MVPFSTVAACTVTLLVSLVLPLAVLVTFALKNKKQGIVSAWLLGAAGFFVTQMVIRLPLLTLLQQQSWFAAFAQNKLALYGFVLAFTAGLFELAGRFGVAKIMEKNLTFNRAVAAGLGHGGIEAVLLVGMTYVNNLVFIAMINSGYFDTLLAQTAAMGVDTAQLELIRTQLITMSGAIFLLAGLERLLTMISHLAMSMLVCYGVARKRVWPCLVLCLAIHTFIDMTAVASLILPQNIAYPVIYTLLAVVAVVSVFVVKAIHRKWKEI